MPNLFIAVFLPVLVAFVVPAYAQNQTQTQTPIEWSTYEDPILELSVNYPSEWAVREEPSTVIFELFNDTDKVVFTSFGTDPVPAGWDTSEEIAKQYMNEKRGEGTEVNKLEPTTVLGKPAYMAEYTIKGEDGSDLGRSDLYFLVDDDQLYSFAMTADPGNHAKYLPTFEKMIDSFRILDK